MRTRLSVGIACVATACLLAALAPIASGQPRGRGGKPKPKADAGAQEAPAAEADAGASAAASTGAAATSATAIGDAGAMPSQAQSATGFYDGGQKPSPLTPAPNEFPAATPPIPPATVDYDKLLGDISTLRARVATVGDSLFHSRIVIAVQADGDHAKIARLTVSLDDGVVYTAQPNFRPDDLTVVYDHAVAPGRHAVTLDVERKDDREETFRTSQRSRLVVDVPKDQRLSLEVKILDDSTMGADFPGDRSGRYDLRVRATATAKPVGK